MYFAEPVLFELPVLPRIKKFIGTKLRDDLGRPQAMLATPANEGAGLMLWAMAQAEKVRLNVGWCHRQKEQPQQISGDGRLLAPADMTERIGLGIYSFHKTRHQYLLNYAELIVFSNFVDYIIHNELMCFVNDNPDESSLSLVQQFCDRYDFSEDELSEGMLKQKVWRHRTAQPNKSLNYDARVVQLHHFVPVRYDLAA